MQKEIKTNYIKGLPYTGSKYKLLPQLLPLFPENINTFVEPFTGGCNIAPNIKANKYLLNDLITPLIALYKTLYKFNKDDNLDWLDYRVKEYNLSKENREGYNQFREMYNDKMSLNSLAIRPLQSLDFFLLICHSFNNQIRFNKKGEFNLPFGSRSFSLNDSIKKNLNDLIDFFKTNDNNIGFSNIDGLEFLRKNLYEINLNDFIYLDPPYLNTYATYNEQDGWNEDNEHQLFQYIMHCLKKEINFGLSNIFINGKCKSTEMHLFIQDYNISKKISVYKLDKNYKNCNHQKSSTNVLQEIYITNVGVNQNTNYCNNGFLTPTK